MNTEELQNIITAQALRARESSYLLRNTPTFQKNSALNAISSTLRAHILDILDANKKDIDVLSNDVSPAFRNRLVLTPEKIEAIAKGVDDVAQLDDPIGEIVHGFERPNGLRIQKIRIPIGVIACIFESRPNVVVDIAALALKSGNACILRGGKESIHTNSLLADLITSAIGTSGLPEGAVQFVRQTERDVVGIMSRLAEYIDLIIPRGGEGLIDAVMKDAKMPVLQHRKGITHMFIDESAKVEDAVRIILNGKTSNPSACNSLEHVLVHERIADTILSGLLEQLLTAGVEIRGCEKTRTYNNQVHLATEEDFAGEYLDMIITIKIVSTFDEAISEILANSTGLSDGIITQSFENANRFVKLIDSAVTYVNASTRFTDGSEFGFGAEVGISTSKIHGMGPMGVADLTVTKYAVYGDGHIRT